MDFLESSGQRRIFLLQNAAKVTLAQYLTGASVLPAAPLRPFKSILSTALCLLIVLFVSLRLWFLQRVAAKRLSRRWKRLKAVLFR